MEYNFKKIGARIRAERKKLGLSQQELCDKINLSQRATLGRFECGTSETPLWVLVELCRVFDCELGFLLCEHNEKTRLNADICEITGLSEKAVENILDLNRGTKPLIGDLRTENIKTLDKILSDKDLKYLLQAISDYRNNKQSDKDSQDFELFKLQKRFISLVNNLDDKN